MRIAKVETNLKLFTTQKWDLFSIFIIHPSRFFDVAESYLNLSLLFGSRRRTKPAGWVWVESVVEYREVKPNVAHFTTFVCHSHSLTEWTSSSKHHPIQWTFRMKPQFASHSPQNKQVKQKRCADNSMCHNNIVIAKNKVMRDSKGFFRRQEQMLRSHW